MIRNVSAVLYDTDNILVHDIYDFHTDQSVVDQDRITRLHVLIEIFVADRNLLLRSVNFIIYKSKLLTFFQCDLLILETSDAHFRSFRIEKRRNRLVKLFAQCFQLFQAHLLLLMGAV